jgi:hypothetical protein
VSLRAFTAGSSAGKLAVISSSEMLARYSKYYLLFLVGGGVCKMMCFIRDRAVVLMA